MAPARGIPFGQLASLEPVSPGPARSAEDPSRPAGVGGGVNSRALGKHGVSPTDFRTQKPKDNESLIASILRRDEPMTTTDALLRLGLIHHTDQETIR
jgi:hypothetical protein